VKLTALPLLDAMLRLASGLFLLLLFGHSAAQAWLVWRHRRRRSRAASPVGEPPAGWPSVDVVVPCYNEDPTALEACFDALAAAALAYQGELCVYLVDGGSPNLAALRPVYDQYSTRPAGRFFCFLAMLASVAPRTPPSIKGVVRSS
jgi:N-acetylglucosaminyltransferase